MDITGKVERIDGVQQISDRFRKRDIVLELTTNPQYPEFVVFQFVQDRTDLLDGFKVGQEVQIHFDIKGRKWTDRNGVEKIFNTLQGWRIQLVSGGGGQPQQPADIGDIPPPPEFPQGGAGGGQVDEIPF